MICFLLKSRIVSLLFQTSVMSHQMASDVCGFYFPMLVEKDHGLTPHRQLNGCGHKSQAFSLWAMIRWIENTRNALSCVSDISDRKKKEICYVSGLV